MQREERERVTESGSREGEELGGGERKREKKRACYKKRNPGGERR